MKDQRGFTLIEMILTTGISLLLFTISTILLTNLIPKAQLSSYREMLQSDLKLQQSRAMSGTNSSDPAGAHFGIKIETQQYILFQGSTYTVDDPNNYVVPLSAQTLTTNFANETILFEPGSGEVSSYNQNANTITISGETTQSLETLTLNRYGVIN